MKPPPFTYIRPATLRDAVDRLDDGGTLLAGGQSLIPMLNLRVARPATVIDISGLQNLSGIKMDGDSTKVGALTNHAEIEAHDWPVGMEALATAAGEIGYPAIRHRGTLGGSLAHADPAAELPTLMVALDAVITLQSATSARTISGGEFFVGYYSTARLDNEVLTSVSLPNRAELKTGFAEFSRRTGDFAVALAAVARWTKDGTPQARVVVGGMDTRPRRVETVEEALRDGHEWRNVCTPAVLSSFTDPPDDIHGSADYRLHLGAEMMLRAIQQTEGTIQ